MADEDPPPTPRLRAPPALADELVEEVLLRSPPDDPARLVRAALVCKRWARLVSARAFRCRFRDFHLRRRGAPMLGFLHNEQGPNGIPSARFVRTSASCAPLDTQRGWIALDARGGRVLLYRTDEHPDGVLLYKGDAASPGVHLAVWDPLSTAGGGHLELPVPILPQPVCTWNAALLCCDQHGLQDHADGPFCVVLVGTDPEGAFACVYSSSGPAAWSEPVYAVQHLGHGLVDEARGALVSNTFYFLFHDRTRILKYDLAMGDISVIGLPPACHSGRRRMSCTVLRTTEDGSLGFARVEGSKLCLWSMELRPNGRALAEKWTQSRVIDLGSLLPGISLVGFADGLGIILVGTANGFFSVDQKSSRIGKLVDGNGFFSDIVPYVSCYTPALGTASTDEGPSVECISA